MPFRALLAAVLAAAVLLPAYSQASTRHQPSVGLAARDGVVLYRMPATSAPVLARLVQQTQIEVVSRRPHWLRVRLWASVTGWVRKGDIVFREPWVSSSTYVPPSSQYGARAHGPRAVTAQANVLASTDVRTAPLGRFVDHLAAGTVTPVTAFLQDSSGKIWYRVPQGWAPGDAFQFRESPPASPLVARIRGKGMWLTLGTVTGAEPGVIIDAAIRTGVTHLYVEAAISPLGFHGEGSVGPLIDAAHRRHIAIIAWVYPYLQDVAADVALTRQVAGFHTSAGFRFDGIAADLERNLDLWRIRAYSQLVRSYLGSRYLLVGVTYPPQSMPDFPYGEVARSYDVIAPMDYWHDTRTSSGSLYGGLRYSSSYGYRYAADSVARIRAAAPGARVAPIGQTFDNFGRLEMGPYAPSRAEITGFLQGSKASGAIGASFFQWMTATDGEWRAIKEYHF